MNVPFRAVLFDLDGTLADTLATIAGVANFALRSLGLREHPLDAYRTFVGDGIVALCRRVLPPGREDLHAELLARARARYADHFLDQARLYDGIRELLDELARRGARLGVLSNKPDALTRKTVDGLGIAPLFQSVIGQREGLAHKPDPAGARLACEELGVAPEELLYVGDTATDMETARRADLAAVGVLWGFRTRQELEASGARWIVAHPREIVAIWDGTAGSGLSRA